MSCAAYGEVVGRSRRSLRVCGVLTGRDGRTVLFIVGLRAIVSAVAQLHIANEFGSSAARELDISTTTGHRYEVTRIFVAGFIWFCLGQGFDWAGGLISKQRRAPEKNHGKVSK